MCKTSNIFFSSFSFFSCFFPLHFLTWFPTLQKHNRMPSETIYTLRKNRIHESRAKRKSRTFLIRYKRVLKSVKSSSILPCIGLTTAKDGRIECNGIVETRCNCTHALGKSGRCGASARVVDFGCRMYATCIRYRRILMHKLLFVYETA